MSARRAGWRSPKPCARRWKAQAGTVHWYRRGYYDDGTPLGSSESSECRIDVIAQSWSVIARRRGSLACGAGDGRG